MMEPFAVGSRLLLPFAVATAAALPGPPAGAQEAAPVRPSALVLITLDTTRADALGSYGAAAGSTPVLDRLAASGTRWATALAPAPLTLPAHASLLTGLEPPEHGVRENGTAVLPPELPTLATRLAARGWTTGAFVASRVLDRRFGLDRGFQRYDDEMSAERLGEYGYPERDAAAVTTAACEWLAQRPPASPTFLWVHYYDPHAPYEPPAPWRSGTPRRDYSGEVAFMDREIGRLLAALAARGETPLVAVVGDHGESLGEHGERGHGLFLYRAALEVPLLLSGPGVPAGRVVAEPVAIRRLAATLLELLGGTGGEGLPGPVLPGLPALDSPPPRPIYSETRMPAGAYGWSPLEALTDGSWKLIRAPRPELYDLAADPAEERNLVAERRERAAALDAALEEMVGSWERRAAPPAPVDPEIAAQLRALGYLSGSDPGEAGIDPKDGIALLAELERAKELLRAGEPRGAAEILRQLVRSSPRSVPFLTQLGAAELAAGDQEAGLAALRRAIEVNPRLEFLHLHLADAYRGLGRIEEARRELETVLELDPRSARAWLELAELAHRAGEADRERRLLEEAVAAGAASALVHARLGQIASASGDLEAVDAHLLRATELAPGWAAAWLLWGENGEAREQPLEAIARYRRAAALEPENPSILLRLGRLLARRGATEEARAILERVALLAPNGPDGRAARRLLAGLRDP